MNMVDIIIKKKRAASLPRRKFAISRRVRQTARSRIISFPR